ncbi:MAG: Xaa-Pro peptidase family protein [Pseudomonadota bacterium]
MPQFAAFPEAEHRQRLTSARHALREAGFEIAVIMAPEHLFYLGGYDSWVAVNSPQAVIFGLADDDEPVIVVRNVDLSLVTETSWVRDIRTYHLHMDDPVAMIAAAAEEKGLRDGPVAMETQSYVATQALAARLQDALSPAPLRDATETLGRLRWFKSDLEIDALHRAARHAEAGLEAARRTLQPGITEITLAAEIEAAMRRSGSDFWAIPTELTSGSRNAGGHGTPRPRVIEPGDLVHMEFAGVDRRYHAVAISTMAAGEPNADDRELYDLTRASLAAGMAAIRPGVPVAEVEEASLQPLRGAGLTEAAMMRFGYGIGIAYPPVWLETLQISRGIDQRLEPGMVFVLHACLALPGQGRGTIQGGTWMLGEAGLEMLAGPGDVPLEVLAG